MLSLSLSLSLSLCISISLAPTFQLSSFPPQNKTKTFYYQVIALTYACLTYISTLKGLVDGKVNMDISSKKLSYNPSSLAIKDKCCETKSF